MMPLQQAVLTAIGLHHTEPVEKGEGLLGS